MEKRLIIYSLTPFCPRCVKTDALMKQVCASKNIEIEKKGLLKSIPYLVIHFRKPPVILINSNIVCEGRVPGEEEVRSWLD